MNPSRSSASVPSPHHLFSLALVLCLAGLVQACSTQQAYGAGQAWQRQECNKIIDAQERGRCMASTNTSYDEYKRQAEAARGTN
ncbi:MAG: hypothetical protein WA210_02675 [Burkholderiaceae bacterium]